MIRLQDLLTRVLWTVFAVLLFLSLLHAVFYVLPGDPVRALFGLRSPGPALIAELRAAFHLDDPYPSQLWRYLSGLLTGDLGPVYRLSPNGLSPTRTSVNDLVWGALPSTLRMVGLALVLETVAGVVLATWMGGRDRRRPHLLRAVVALLIAVPPFALAGLLVFLGPGRVEALSLIAGAACLAALPSGMVALFGQTVISDVRAERFVVRAVASGVRPGRIRWLHVLRPTLGGMVVVAAAQSGTLMTGAVLVEPVLGRPGVGAVLTAAITSRQGPTILAVVGISVVLVAALNLVADLTTMALDPRTRG